MERRRRPAPLVVLAGDGEADDGGFEPLECTPIGTMIPSPARLVEASTGGVTSGDNDPLEPEDSSSGASSEVSARENYGAGESTASDGDPSAGIMAAAEHAAAAESAENSHERVASMLSGAQQLFEQGTCEGSLWLCERVLAVDPESIAAQDLKQRNRELLLQQSRERIGDLERIPVVRVPQHEIMWHKLDHRAGFLLSRIDGELSFEEVVDVSGMDEFEACRILSQLLLLGVIGP